MKPALLWLSLAVVLLLNIPSSALQSTARALPKFDDTPGNAFHREEAASKAKALHLLRASAKAPSTNQTKYDVGFYSLDLLLDPTTPILSGTVEMTASVVDGPIDQVEMDLDGAMLVGAVRVNDAATTFTHGSGLLTIDLDQSYANGQSFKVSVDYSGRPNESLGAFGFDTQDGFPMIWSLSEPYGARTWWPCKDTPSDKADSARIKLTVPSALTAISNGVLQSTSTQTVWKTFNWFEKHPIAAYLISLAVHRYIGHTAYYTSMDGNTVMPVNAWSYLGSSTSAGDAVNTVVSQLETFAPLFGEYPFVDEKYDQAQFPWGGGMEHQTATSICCFLDWVMAHELAHQWYGDAITCQSFSHIWLNEGFATYAEALWQEAIGGPTAYHNEVEGTKYYGPGTIYVPPADLVDEGRIFDSDLSYNKGSWVLHMLRGMVGDTTFFDIMRAWTADPSVRYGTATTEDFQALAASISGRNLSNFFQNWIYGEYYPTYTYSWNAVDQGGSWDLTVDIDQLQSDKLYEMPVPLRVTTTSGVENFKVENNAYSQTFHLSTSAEPVTVELDPDDWILKTVEQKVESPPFNRGILVVNGVSWNTYGSTITSEYADSTLSGGMPFSFWDAFNPPSGGYIPELPTPLGNGDIPADSLGQFSTVVWVGNNYAGDLTVWNNASILSYLRQGGNVLLLCRTGQSFLPPLRASYPGIRFAEGTTTTINQAHAVYPSLVDMPLIGTQDQSAVFETSYDQPEAVTLMEDDTSFSVPRAIAVWRQPDGGGVLRHSGGHFAHIAGRPYYYSHPELKANIHTILTSIFQEDGVVTDTPPVARRELVLHEPVPNPFNPRVSLRYSLARAGHAKLSIYDLRGRLVRVLLDENLPQGEGTVQWDGKDGSGHTAASGVYSFVLQADGQQRSQKATLIR
jgi:hypothetical protein